MDMIDIILSVLGLALVGLLVIKFRGVGLKPRRGDARR